MTDRAELEAAAALVHAAMTPTPQIAWPLLSARAGTEVWVKHENATPIGAFKIRGGLVYMDDLRRREPDCPGVIAATRGNHGQSVAVAARRNGLDAVIVVPEGNSREKNAAMRAQGAALVEHGHDFQAALEHARDLAAERGLHMVPSFHDLLIRGVGTYALEFLTAVPDLDTVYVPIGLGSGICGMIAARDALGAGAEIVGVVAEQAPAYALSFRAGAPVSTNSADTMADGLACRVPVDDAVVRINAGAARIVAVSEAEIKAAMRHLFTDTHQVAEGAGAAALAALLKERNEMKDRKVGIVLSGGNVDIDVYRAILSDDETEDGKTGDGA
jgi:threonine dehydratase